MTELIIVLQFVGHSPSGYGISFYCDCTRPTILLWLLLCLWGIFFGGLQCPPVNSYSIASCSFGPLQEEMSARIPAPPS